jgi:hypothetical protein
LVLSTVEQAVHCRVRNGRPIYEPSFSCPCFCRDLAALLYVFARGAHPIRATNFPMIAVDLANKYVSLPASYRCSGGVFLRIRRSIVGRFVAVAGLFATAVSNAAESKLTLANDALRLTWQQTADGWRLQDAFSRSGREEASLGLPSGEYTLLFTANAPSKEGDPLPWRGNPDGFPEPVFKHTQKMWRQAMGPAAMNTAGEVQAFFPKQAHTLPDGGLQFCEDTPVARVVAGWRLAPSAHSDILVSITITAKRSGYFSIASPSLATISPEDLGWAMVPGVFAGSQINPDLVLSYGYGQGVPEIPVLARERSTSTLMSLVSRREGPTLAVIAEPGVAANPWEQDHDTRAKWRLGLSVMNRQGQLTPTLWHPVLGEDGSKLEVGQTCTFQFRYSLGTGDWFAMLNHAAYDVYRLSEFLNVRRPQRSLSSRLERLRTFLTNPELSRWRVEAFEGRRIGAQFYGSGTVSGVVAADGDAMKNSDYGAMWMLGRLTGDPIVLGQLPFARAFKLAQQQDAPGFFQGAAMGQYYLFKSKRFVEEWGHYVEPVALTYYTLSDFGNILLFDPSDEEVRARLKLGAEKLLSWQYPDGHWEVAYGRTTGMPVFGDLRDYRPTFYGLLVAWRILGEEKYLTAARRGADWLIENAVKPQAYLGVCGDARFVPDFATAQIAQALLDLAEITGDQKYRDAGIAAARFYATSVYTHPLSSEQQSHAGGKQRSAWEISQMGLGFEHGGTLGSAIPHGPILLASHAGLFLRVSALTGDPLLRDMARAAALARDAFVEPSTGVASYYWGQMNAGAGPYPHHAWWQIGWIIDYLLSEAQLRSAGAISFPRGFFTPKVGPHASYGFAPGVVFGIPASLIWKQLECGNPAVDSLCAVASDGSREFMILLNDSAQDTDISLAAEGPGAFLLSANGARSSLPAVNGRWNLSLSAWGLVVIEVPKAHGPNNR